jgi:hypothetical protein
LNDLALDHESRIDFLVIAIGELTWNMAFLGSPRVLFFGFALLRQPRVERFETSFRDYQFTRAKGRDTLKRKGGQPEPSEEGVDPISIWTEEKKTFLSE